MDAVAITLTLLAAVAHALWNLTLHDSGDRPAAMAVSGLIGGVALLPFTIASPPWRVAGLMLISAAAESAYAQFLVAAYQRGELSFTYPIGRGTGPLVATFLAWAVLSERPGVAAVAGAVALLAGLTLVATAGHKQGRGEAVAFALAVGAAIAVYSVIDARAVRRVNPLGYLGPVLIVQGLATAARLRFDVARLRRAGWTGARIAFGVLVAYLLVLFAFRRAGAGRVATLREVSVLLGVLLSGDRPTAQVWLGASLVVAGAVLTAA